MDSTRKAAQAGFIRRLMAMFYDCLILAAVLLLATAILLPFTHGQAIPEHNHLYKTYLILLVFGFFAWFWTHGGQTLGMLAWKLKVETKQGKPLTLLEALIRFLTAIPSLLLAGIGLIWVIFDRDKLALHDRWSNTRVVRLPKE